MRHAYILNCVNYADVNATMYAGGIVGNAASGIAEVETVVEGCVNHGYVNGRSYAGGLVGFAAYETNVSGTNYGEIVSAKTPVSAILGKIDDLLM